MDEWGRLPRIAAPSSPECFIKSVDAEFLHFHHGLKDVLQAPRIGIADHLAKDRRNDLPPHAEFVL